jgi:hypothetical protein
MGERKATDLTVDEVVALLATHAKLCRDSTLYTDIHTQHQSFLNALNLALLKAKP